MRILLDYQNDSGLNDTGNYKLLDINNTNEACWPRPSFYREIEMPFANKCLTSSFLFHIYFLTSLAATN